MSENKTTTDQPQPLTSHLKELRNRIIHVVLFLVLGFLICLHFAGNLVTLLTDMGSKYGYSYIYIAPQELMMVYITVALIGAVVIAFPCFAYEAYQFSKPGLTKRECSAFLTAVLFGSLCFVVGVLFSYFISIPFMLYFLISFTGEVAVTARISIQEFITFILTVMLIFGVIFEMPLISIVLSRLGILRPDWLIKARKPAIVLIFFIAAVITPPDVVSQCITAVPMCLLYELSIYLSKLTYREREKDEDEEEDSEE